MLRPRISHKHARQVRHVVSVDADVASSLRTSFVDFFTDANHTHIPSSSLVPSNDPSLLFTNAGMVQFKDVFLGREQPDYRAAVTVQRCMRAGGKHNDLDNVGFTPRHHTLFEMLGNFSFGEYFKEEAIRLAWTFVTRELQLAPDRLRVTVHRDDEESARLWRAIAPELPAGRIVPLGDADNFWSMGDVGPCGPCTEIFVDQGAHIADEEERWLEIWNLVFMQFDRSGTGALTPLPLPCVDTGMGLERVAAVLQGKTNNFETSLFSPLTEAVAQSLPRCPGPHAPAARIIADHARAAVCLVADGVTPGNTGRGYVLRRIVRRAQRFAHEAGATGPVLPPLASLVAAGLAGAWPELPERVGVAQAVLAAEEEAFSTALARGLSLLRRQLASDPGGVSADTAFLLYDSLGFPLDVTKQVAAEHGVAVDESGFDRLLERQRERARAAWCGGGDAALPSALAGAAASSTLRRDVLQLDAGVRAVSVEDDGAAAWVVFAETPCYPEGGGQCGDTGTVSFPDASGELIWASITNTVKNPAGAIASLVRLDTATHSGAPVPPARAAAALSALASRRGTATVSVDAERRQRTAAHHTATHVLHAALRRVLGPGVVQAGSSVGPDGLRFDFTHGRAVSPHQLAEVEALVAGVVAAGGPVGTREVSVEVAKQCGALAHFGEKYGDAVRVVTVAGDGELEALDMDGAPAAGGYASVELCGGTHVASAADLFPFKITGESSVAAGTRRIEAVAGRAGVEWLCAQHQHLVTAAKALDCPPAAVPERVEAALSRARAAKADAAALREALTAMPALPVRQVSVGGHDCSVHMHTLPASAGPLAAKRAAALAASEKNAVHVVVAGSVVAAARHKAGPDTHCGNLVRRILECFGGKGGGKATAAQGRAAKDIDVAAAAASLE